MVNVTCWWCGKSLPEEGYDKYMVVQHGFDDEKPACVACMKLRKKKIRRLEFPGREADGIQY